MITTLHAHTDDFTRDERGTTAILFSLLMFPIIGLVAISVDFGRSTLRKAELQQALDAAVLSAMLRPENERIAAATAYFDQNIQNGTSGSVKPTFTLVGSDGLKGSASVTVKTFFGQMLGKNQVNVLAETEAKISSSSSKVCVLLLDKTANQAFLVNSGANIDAPSCEIHVKSTGNPAAIFNSNTNISTKRICIQGKNIIDNGGYHPNLEKECSTANDIYAGNMPAPPSTTCTFNNLNYGGKNPITLSPGVYCGWFNFNDAVPVNFNPGVYVIKSGGWNVNGGHWSGKGVTFYYDDTSKIQFNSGISTDLTAPTSGTYRDILMYEKAGLSQSDFIFNDSKGSFMEGLLYLPSRNVTYNTDSHLDGNTITAVFNRLTLNTMEWDIAAGDHAIPTGGGGSGGGAVQIIK